MELGTPETHARATTTLGVRDVTMVSTRLLAQGTGWTNHQSAAHSLGLSQPSQAIARSALATMAKLAVTASESAQMTATNVTKALAWWAGCKDAV